MPVYKLEDTDYALRNDTYRDKVYPWLKGGYNPDIPNYYSVEHKDFLDTLRGRKGE